MAGKFRSFRKPIYCPNACSLGFARHSVSVGDLILYREHYRDGSWGTRLARVLGLATHDGTMKPYPKPRLAVLAASDMLDHGYERHVALEDVQEVRDPSPENGRAFARFFLFGKVPPPELAYAVSEYGAMCDSYLGDYLTAPEGEVRKDWKGAKKAG